MEPIKLLFALVGGHVLPEEAEGPARRTRIVMLGLLAATGLAAAYGVAAGSTDAGLAFGNLWKVPMVVLLSSLFALPAALLTWRVTGTVGRASDLLIGLSSANLTGALVLFVLAPLVALYYHTSGWLGGVLAISATVLSVIVGAGVLVRAVWLRASAESRRPGAVLRLGAPVAVLGVVYLLTMSQLLFLASPILPEITVFDGGMDAVLGG